jgi:hypothetical protein
LKVRSIELEMAFAKHERLDERLAFRVFLFELKDELPLTKSSLIVIGDCHDNSNSLIVNFFFVENLNS